MKNATFAAFVGVASSFLYLSILTLPLLGGVFFLLSATPFYILQYRTGIVDLPLALATSGIIFAGAALLKLIPEGSSLTAFLSFSLFIFLPAFSMKKCLKYLSLEQSLLALSGGVLALLWGISLAFTFTEAGSGNGGLYAHIHNITMDLLSMFMHIQMPPSSTTQNTLLVEQPLQLEEITQTLTYAIGFLSSIILFSLHGFSLLATEFYFKKQDVRILLHQQKTNISAEKFAFHHWPYFFTHPLKFKFIGLIFLGSIFLCILIAPQSGAPLFYSLMFLGACAAPTVLQGGITLLVFMQKFLPQIMKFGVYMVLALAVWLLPILIVLLLFSIGLFEQAKHAYNHNK